MRFLIIYIRTFRPGGRARRGPEQESGLCLLIRASEKTGREKVRQWIRRIAPSFRARRWLQGNVDSPQHEQLGRERTFRLAGIFTQNVPRVSSGRAEIEDEVPFGLPRPSEFEQPNAACS